MTISEMIEKNFEHNFDNSWDFARLASMEYFARLVEDLTDSEVLSYGYYESHAVAQFELKNFSKMLTVNFYDDELADCTKNIILETQDFLSENKRKDL